MKLLLTAYIFLFYWTLLWCVVLDVPFSCLNKRFYIFTYFLLRHFLLFNCLSSIFCGSTYREENKLHEHVDSHATEHLRQSFNGLLNFLAPMKGKVHSSRNHTKDEETKTSNAHSNWLF
jgi:hypothetical protein